MIKRTPLAVIKAISEGRFLFLLVFLLIYIGFTPFLYEFVRLRPLNDIFFGTVLVSAVYAVSENRNNAIIATSLMLPMLIFTWLLYWQPNPYFDAIRLLLGILFLGYTVVLLTGFLFKAREVTRHVIWASVSGYLLMGIFWAFLYRLVENLHPGSFSFGPVQAGEEGYDFLYFSYVTLSTLGYGDYTPVSADARGIAMLQALIGQLYLAVLVARLVGIHISRQMSREENKKAP